MCHVLPALSWIPRLHFVAQADYFFIMAIYQLGSTFDSEHKLTYHQHMVHNTQEGW